MRDKGREYALESLGEPMGENEPPKSSYVDEGEAGFEGVCARNWPLVGRLNGGGLRDNYLKKLIRFNPSSKVKNERKMIDDAYFRIYAPIKTASACCGCWSLGTTPA